MNTDFLKSFATENMQAQIDAANNERLTQKVAELHRENALLMGEKSRLIEGNAQLVRDNAALREALGATTDLLEVAYSASSTGDVVHTKYPLVWNKACAALASTEPKRDFSAAALRC